MKKLVVMLLIASFAAFGSIAYAGEGPTKINSDSTMTKKMTKKKYAKSSKTMKSSKETKSSKSMKMREKKKTSSKEDSTKTHKMKSKSMK